MAAIVGLLPLIAGTQANAAQDVVSNINNQAAVYNTSDFTSNSEIPTLGVSVFDGSSWATPSSNVFVITKNETSTIAIYSDQESFTVSYTPSAALLTSTGSISGQGNNQPNGNTSGIMYNEHDIVPSLSVDCQDLTITTTKDLAFIGTNGADTSSATTNTITIRITVLETSGATVPTCAALNPSSSQSSSSTDAAALAAAEAKRKAEIVAAKSSLLADIKAIKSPTLAQYRAADYGVTQQATVDRINTQVLELQAKTPTVALTEAQILPVIQKESFVEYVSTDVTQGRVTSRQLIDNSIITSDYRFRASVLRAIKNASVADLNTYAKIKAVADAEIASIQARKDRLEAIIKKISGLK